MNGEPHGAASITVSRCAGARAARHGGRVWCSVCRASRGCAAHGGAPPSSCTWRRFRGWQRQWAARATAPAMEPGKGRPPRSGHFPQCSPCDVHSHHHRTLVGNRFAFGRLPGIAAFQGLVRNYNLELAAITSFPKHGERGKVHGAVHPVLEKSSPPAAVQPRGSTELLGSCR